MKTRSDAQPASNLVAPTVRAGRRKARLVRTSFLFTALLVGSTASLRQTAHADTVIVPNITNLQMTTSPGYMQTTVANPQSIAPGAATTITTSVMAMQTPLNNGIIAIAVYNAANQRVGMQYWANQSIAKGQSVPKSYAWTAPAAGSYSVAVGVYGATGTPAYLVAPNVTTITAATPPPPSNVPVPTNLAAQPDDRAAVLTWNADMRPGSSDPAGVHGYKVTWGPQSNPTQFSALTMYRIIEAQPLVNGQPYVATIQAIDNDGHISAPSAPLTFTGDSSRVDALRTQMTGFFDDFNSPQLSMLAPDARKWNTAVSYCNNNPALQGMFLNDQSHVHNMVADSNCDRGISASRPRAVFDFTGRTGTITFDLDGTQRRDFWYLDLVPSLMDMDGESQLDGGPHGGTPNMLRIQQSGQQLSAYSFDNTGFGISLPNNAPGAYDGKVAWDNLTLVPNVRRHWTLHISQHHIDIFINGVEEYSNDTVSIPFTKASLVWALFSYNTRKSNEDRTLMHWDNFGFDGPAPTTVTHNYISAGCCQGGDFKYLSAANHIATTTVSIADSLQGETTERLMFGLVMPVNQYYQWAGTDSATVNGHACPIAQPGPSTIPQTQLVSDLSPYQVVCTLPLGTLHTGSNTVTFNLANSGIINIHAEVDFPWSSEPNYTQPGLAGMSMSLPDIGPGATIDQVGTCTDSSCYTWANEHGPFTAKGIVSVKYSVQENVALNGNGKVPGIHRVQITVDGQVVLDRLTDAQAPAPAVSDVFNLDTTKLSNGAHQIRILAWNANGTSSIPDYFQAESTEGTDWPIALQVGN